MCECGELYVGSTIQTLKISVLEHRSYMKNKILEDPMVEHYCEKT